MADSANTQKQGDKPTITPSNSRAIAMLNKIINLPPETSSTIEFTSQTKNQSDKKHQSLSSSPQSHDPPNSPAPSQPDHTPNPDQQSVSHQPQFLDPMSFTSQPREQANLQPHLRGGCDDESCDCCCCAYPRYGPPTQPWCHWLWYGKPGTG